MFGWWGLLSLIIALPFIGWKDRHKGPFPTRQRWSLCFSFNGDVIYELTHERAGVLLGFIMLRFYKHKAPKSGWEVQLVFNKKDTAIMLDEKYFQNDQMPERELYILMESIDPDHSNFGNSSVDPVFFSRSPYKIIPLQSDLSFKEMIENPGKASSIVTFGDKMDEVFG
ncbi:MAG: hypothetical protein CMP48_23105 [Rickettsiales bacterium]|nr:hypothetical protein [Rickettsiales bacterium]